MKLETDEFSAWCLSDGRLHREDGPAYVHYASATSYWCYRGVLHRRTGTAIDGKSYVVCSIKSSIVQSAMDNRHVYMLHGHEVTLSVWSQYSEIETLLMLNKLFDTGFLVSQFWMRDNQLVHKPVTFFSYMIDALNSYGEESLALSLQASAHMI